MGREHELPVASVMRFSRCSGFTTMIDSVRFSADFEYAATAQQKDKK
jgi:hypothetical protein